MTQHALLSVYKGLGYSESKIRALLAAAEKADFDSISAARDGLSPLTPMQASAKSALHAAKVKSVRQMAYHASGCKYQIPLNAPVDLDALNIAMSRSHATAEQKIRVKTGLAELGLIA